MFTKEAGKSKGLHNVFAFKGLRRKLPFLSNRCGNLLRRFLRL